MEQKALRYLLFPHTSLSSRDYRHAAILLPHLYLLQVIREPAVPDWGREHFHVWPAIDRAQTLDRIRLCLEGYQEFARVHGERFIEASLSHESILREACESRYRIQEELRSTGKEEDDPRESALVTAATFLEMALDLDERERELETGYAELESLEGEFREILGIDEEEELEEALETVNLPFTHTRTNLSFMLSRRMSSWFQLFSAHPLEGFPVLVTTSGETLEELLDPLRTEYDRAGNPLEMIEIDLGSIPRLDRLQPERFLSLLHEVQGSEVLQSYRQSVEKILRAPDRDNALAKEVKSRAEYLQESIRNFLGEMPATGEVGLSLTCFRDLELEDLWRLLDKKASKIRSEDQVLQSIPTVFLCLQ